MRRGDIKHASGLPCVSRVRRHDLATHREICLQLVTLIEIAMRLALHFFPFPRLGERYREWTMSSPLNLQVRLLLK